MPLNLSDNLGPKVDLQSGRWIPVSETFITAISGAMSQRRLIVAQVSDLYLVRVYMEVTSATVAGGSVTPQVSFWTYGSGNGQGVLQQGAPMAAVQGAATSSCWMMIRAANSDIFISAAAPAGVPPVVNLYWSISRPS